MFSSFLPIISIEVKLTAWFLKTIELLICATAWLQLLILYQYYCCKFVIAEKSAMEQNGPHEVPFRVLHKIRSI
jgi:hypothetical protein